MSQISHAQAVEAAKHCPHCGYTDEDKLIHGDHYICDQRNRKPSLSAPGPSRDAEWCRNFVTLCYMDGKEDERDGSSTQARQHSIEERVKELTAAIGGRLGATPEVREVADRVRRAAAHEVNFESCKCDQCILARYALGIPTEPAK